jgi:hypothetical protein
MEKKCQCGKKIKARGLCNSCYQWARTHNKLQQYKTKGRAKCRVCDKPADSHGYCLNHYRQRHKIEATELSKAIVANKQEDVRP